MNKNQVLKQRSLTGLIFGIFVLSLILSGNYGTIALGFLVAGFSSFEYSRMIFPLGKSKMFLSLMATILTIFALICINPDSDMFFYLSLLSCIMLAIGIINMFFPFISHQKTYLGVCIFYFGLPLGLFISFLWNSSHNQSDFWVAIIGLIWVSDSFAYLFGSRLGKHKLLEKISPKKTWEGFIGGGIFTLGFGLFLEKYFFTSPQIINSVIIPYDGFTIIFWMSVALIVWIIGTLGDLVESSVKRKFNIKDSGNILPGHGGVLDRFDSFIYILPFVLFLLLHFKNQ